MIISSILKWKRVIVGTGGFLLLMFVICLTTLVWLDTRTENKSQAFQKLERADTIEVIYDISSQQKILIIKEPKKIEFALDFIKRYPDGWKEPFFVARVGAYVNFSFFEGDQYLGAYGISPRNLTLDWMYIRPLAKNDHPYFLLQELEIPISSDFKDNLE